MNSAKMESHYKVLGTTAKIGQGRIREKYIEAVKKYPPESDPEMFEKVRAAYDVLKNPAKRKEYDLFRKYGNKVELMISKAYNYLETGEHKQARVLLENALAIEPNNAASLIGMMDLAIIGGKLPQAKKYFKQALKATDEEDEQAIMYTVKARILEMNGYGGKALQLLDEGKKALPEQALAIDTARAFVYLAMDRGIEAWNVFVQITKEHEMHGEESIEFYLNLLFLFVEIEKWEKREWLGKQFRSFLKTVENEEVRQELYERLLDEYEQYRAHTHYMGAEVYVSFALMISQEDKELQKEQKEIKKMALIQREMLRLDQDEQAYPLLYIRTLEWFFEDSIMLAQILSRIPEGMAEHFEEDQEAYAGGILYLKKKYPLLYKEYKKRWDDIFAEITQGFNREMKRMLNKMK